MELELFLRNIYISNDEFNSKFWYLNGPCSDLKSLYQFIAVWPNSKENVIEEILAYAFGLNPKTIE